MNPKLFSLLLATAVAFSFGACANKKGGNYVGTEGDTVNGTPLPDRQEGVSFMSGNVDKSQFKPIHFAFDSFAIDPGEEGELSEVAAFLKSDSKNVIIAGFTDERGTPEYNRGLGERRALAVRQYLPLARGGRRKDPDRELRRGDARRPRLQRKRVGQEPPRRVWRGAVTRADGRADSMACGAFSRTAFPEPAPL